MNIKRTRGRGYRGGTGGGGGGGGGGGAVTRQQGGGVPLNRNHVFDSSGPDLRIRGTSQQLFEKYLQLGRDSTGSGDRVMAESYFQYAEHYFRILNAMNQAVQQQGGQQGAQQGGQPNGQNQQRRTHHSDNDGQEGGEGEEGDMQPSVMGEHPSGESRDIPIAAVPPER